MLAMVAVAGLFAQAINLPGIVGAFLAGLGPVLTERFLPRMMAADEAPERNRNAMGVADPANATAIRR